MNKHILLAILLISIFFIFTTCGAKEMFSPDPEDRMMEKARSVQVATTPKARMMEKARSVQVATTPKARMMEKARSVQVATPPEARMMEDEITNDLVANAPVATDPVVMEATSRTINSDFDVDLNGMIRTGQPAAPPPSGDRGMGYYNFAKTVYM